MADADMNAESDRQRLAARRGYASMVRTTQRGTADYGMNSQAAGLGAGGARLLGSGAR